MDVNGFRSVDEHPSRATQSKVILHEGEDLISIHAGAVFGKLTRALFDRLFCESDRGKFILSPRRKEDDGRTAAPENLLEKFMSKNLCNYFGTVEYYSIFPTLKVFLL